MSCRKRCQSRVLHGNILIVDLGCNGAMFVGRVGSYGPEIVSLPTRWKHRNRRGWDKHHEEVEDQYRLRLRTHKPRFVAFEKPESVMGRKHVGISQAYFVGRFTLIAENAPTKPRIVQVPGQHGDARVKAWGILRPSLFEIAPRELVREFGQYDEGEPGEHVVDACAIFLAAIPRAVALQ